MFDWDRRSTLDFVFYAQPAHVAFRNQKFGNGKTAVVSWFQKNVQMRF
jgi:hypothetical protein